MPFDQTREVPKVSQVVVEAMRDAEEREKNENFELMVFGAIAFVVVCLLVAWRRRIVRTAWNSSVDVAASGLRSARRVKNAAGAFSDEVRKKADS